MPIDPSKPILELDYPEFYDVKITNTCSGKCSYCYQNSNENEPHYSDILEKINTFFGGMTENQKPFQVAIGGGNPNEHPDFGEVLEKFYTMGITPNYTTNGMGLTSDILTATKKYSGGVAVTCHEHLDSTWRSAVYVLLNNKVKVNLHILIKSLSDIESFKGIFNAYKEYVDYFVLLPLTETGRAKGTIYNKEEVANTLFDLIENLNTRKIAFGANYYPLSSQER